MSTLREHLRAIAYRSWMRFIHRHGYHYAPINPGLAIRVDGPRGTPIGTKHAHWCQWCGLRGSTLEIDSDPSRVTTLREHLEAICEAAKQTPYRYEPPLEFLADIESYAMAALAILDASARVDGGPLRHALEQFRLVPDPPSAT